MRIGVGSRISGKEEEEFSVSDGNWSNWQEDYTPPSVFSLPEGFTKFLTNSVNLTFFFLYVEREDL